MVRFALLFTLILTCGCGGSKPASRPANPDSDSLALRPITLQLNWRAEAEHGGFFAAQAAGYFTDEGLELKIVSGGPNVPVIQEVARGEATFGVATADQVLQGRAAGAKVVALMAAMQNSPRCILVHEESGITNFDALKDVTLAVRPGISFFEYIKKKSPLTNVEVVPYTGTVKTFLTRKDYAQQAYVFSEPYQAELEGAKVRSLMVSDLGYNPYTTLLITRQNRLEEDPELVRKVTRATVRGWQKYLDDPAPANALIRKLNPDISPQALEFGAEAIKPLCLPEGAELGQMTTDRWQTLLDQLVEVGLIKPDKVTAEEAFTTQFLPEPPAMP